MKKGLMIGLVCGFVAVATVLVLLFVINPIRQTGSFMEPEQIENLFDNLVIEPSSINANIEPGENIFREFQISNNNNLVVFVRCGIYNKDAGNKYAPHFSCQLPDGEEAVSGFIEIPAGEMKEFSVEIKSEKDTQYITQTGSSSYTVTTDDGTYNAKVLIGAGTQAEEQEVKEIELNVVVE